MIIGICGGIGSGKSVVSRILRLRGACVYDCDLEARRIMDSSEEVLDALHRRFGDEVCPPGGPICRPALARHVFGSDEERDWINALVHRLVREDVAAWHDSLSRSGIERCYVESAILASSGLADMCDEILLVSAPEDVRIERVRSRDSLDEDNIRKRIRSQQEEMRLDKSSGNPIVEIDNDGDSPLLSEIP